MEVVVKNTKAKTCDGCGKSVFVEKGVDIVIATPTRLVMLAEEGGQNAFHGVGTVMSANHVERVIEELGYEWMRFDDPDLNTPNKRLYQYDWAVSNNIAGYEQAQSFEDKPLYGGRRFWLIKKSFAND
jgi:hypothetical protein